MLQQRLSIAMASLAVLGTLMLGIGQQDATLPLVTLAVAVTAVYFTDIKQRFYLNPTIANLAAVVAVLFSLLDFSAYDRTRQLLAIANLLVYLQIVVLYQPKNTRRYWELAMLSLLQVVVAAALSFSLFFGLLLVVYLFVGLTALALLFIDRETKRYRAAGWSGSSGGLAPTATDFAAARTPNFVAVAAGEVERQTFAGAVPRVVVRMGLTTLVLAIVAFVAVPRFGRGFWQSGGVSTQRSVGFSQKVALNSLGEVILNPEKVMRVEFVDIATGESFRLREEPLLRGSVLQNYRDGEWTQARRNKEVVIAKLSPVEPRPGMVRQIITLNPLIEPVVFAIYPAFSFDRQEVVRRDKNLHQLVRSKQFSQSQISVELATTAIHDRKQASLEPWPDYFSDWHHGVLTALPPRVRDRDPLAGLKETAARVVADAGMAPGDHRRIARTLEAYLHHEGGFKYSLGRRAALEGIDPIEDFVVNSRSGHCEYFASALVLMLRSQGIPARVVLGFKGGEWNSLGSFYQFRQLHAHAWVEAYMRSKDLTAAERRSMDRANEDASPRSTDKAKRRGAWLRLDPTAVDEDAAAAATGLMASMGEMAEYVQMLWIKNVIGMSYQKQQQHIYNPVGDSFTELAQSLMGRGASSTRLAEWLGRLNTAIRGNWFSWRGGLVGMIICLVLVGIYRLVQFAWRRLRRAFRARRPSTAAGAQSGVEFYRRLERLLARAGYRRATSQTPREFAAAAGGQLATSSESCAAAPLPRQVVEAFYCVRFGHRDLDKRQVDAVEQALEQLEASLRESRGGRPRRRR